MELRLKLKSLFEEDFFKDRGVVIVSDISTQEWQSQTNGVFSDKWTKYSFAPSNSERYSADQFIQMVKKAGLIERAFLSEEACHSGRFKKPCVV
tara:strand:- start:186 stop:467 length:282 start_codon:yes stop_codon:yes gene_type:complete